MRRRNLGRLVGADLDWFVIPVRKVTTWGLLIALVAGGSILGYRAYVRGKPTAEDRARAEIETASTLVTRATRSSGTVRPGSNVARALGLLQEARTANGDKRYDDAVRLAVESQSYSRRVLGGWDENGDASFIFVEGEVALQRAGRSNFENARQRQPLFDGDFIKTGRNGSAEIMFSDGTLFTIRPGSLFEVRRPSASDTSGSEVKMVSGAVNVYTSASPSTIATDDATAAIERDSRVSVDVAAGEKTEVTTYRGRTTVSTGLNTMVLEGRQSVVAAARTGVLSPRVVLPESPRPLGPDDNRTFDLTTGGDVELKWSRVPEAVRYRIQISRSRLFVPDANEVDLDNRTGLSAEIKVSREGSYFWRLAAINREGVSSDWSAVRRFRMSSEPIQAGSGDVTPPELSVLPPQQMGNLFLIFGKTEKGAVVTVNAEPADVSSDGSFKKTVTIERDGYAMLVIKAVDAAGNETIRRMRVFVETL
ncbi:MAG TPA: FecR domain-containing protein [Thermoanaerobaculia bacterium]|nr:FecR domain-containing protein [Thermoanaerobaculia bacterium]